MVLRHSIECSDCGSSNLILFPLRAAHAVRNAGLWDPKCYQNTKRHRHCSQQYSKKMYICNLSVSYFCSHVYMLFHLFCSCIFCSAVLHVLFISEEWTKKRCFSPLKPNTNYLQSRNPRDKREKIGRHEMFRGVFCVSFGIFFPPHACWCWFWCFLVRNMFMSHVFSFIFSFHGFHLMNVCFIFFIFSFKKPMPAQTTGMLYHHLVLLINQGVNPLKYL